MRNKTIVLLLTACMTWGCSCGEKQEELTSWNQTQVKERIVEFLNHDVEKIPVEKRVAVFDMDGTLVSEKPFGIETVVSIYRLLDMGKKSDTVRQWTEYKWAEKLAVNPRDTSVLNHGYDKGHNYFESIILKPFDGADAEEYVDYVNQCLNRECNPDYGLKYADLFYEPMLELIEALKRRQFEIYIVSASMQGIVWGICPQVLGLERSHLIGIRHEKEVELARGRRTKFRIKGKMMHPVNNYEGKAINFYNQTGKVPVVAAGNAHSDFGMLRMASESGYPYLSLLLRHDDAKREYEYPAYYAKNYCWEDTVKSSGWTRVDMTKEFKVIWKKATKGE